MTSPAHHEATKAAMAAVPTRRPYPDIHGNGSDMRELSALWRLPLPTKEPRPMDERRLNEIRQRADSATEGPWSVYVMKHGATYITRPDLRGVAREWSMFWEPADAEFIAWARDDVPDLLAEVDRLKAENDQLHAELRHYRDGRPRLDRSVQP